MKYFIKLLLFIILLVLVLPAIGKCQVKPSEFPEEIAPTNSNFEVYSQKGGINKRASLDNLKNYMLPAVFGTIAYVPTPSGNPTNRGQFVTDPNGDSWYISATGVATVLGKSYSAGTGISITGSTITNTGDTNGSDDITTAISAAGDVTGLFSNLQIAANAVGTAEIADDAVTGDKISSTGASSGQVLKYNGTTWVPSSDDGMTYTAGTGISIAGSTITNTGDTNGSDDITTAISAAGDVTGLFSNLQIAANAIGTAEIADNAISANKIANAQVTFPKIQNISSGTLVGRSSAGAGSPETITIGGNLTLTSGVLNTNGTPITGTGVSGRIPYFSGTNSVITNSGFFRIIDGANSNYSYVFNESGTGVRIGRSSPVKNFFNEQLTIKASYDGSINYITPVVIEGVTPTAGNYNGNLGLQLVCYGDGINQAGSGLIALARYGNTQSDYAMTFGLSDQGGNRVPFYMRADGQSIYNGSTPTLNTAHTFYGRTSLSTTNAVSFKNGGGTSILTLRDDLKVYLNSQTGASNAIAQISLDGELLRTSIDPTTLLTTATVAAGDVTGPFSNLQIAADAVTTSEIAPGTITLSDMANSSVNSNVIVNGSIGAFDLSDQGAATGDVLRWAGIGNGWTPATPNGDITGPITNLQIASNAVGLNELGNGAVDPAAIFFSGYSYGSTIYSDGSTWVYGQSLRENYTDNNLGGGTGSYTATSTRPDNLIRGSNWTALTVNLPSSPSDGQVCTITFDVSATTVTFSGNGKTLVGTLPGSIAVGDNFSFKFYSATDKWYRVKL